jgi:hypothetical protein
MEEIEKVEKRLKFLRELHKRGVEGIESQIDRYSTEVTLFRIKIELEKRKERRHKKIKKLGI